MEEEKKLSVYIFGPLQIFGRDCACDARRNPNHCQQIKKKSGISQKSSRLASVSSGNILQVYFTRSRSTARAGTKFDSFVDQRRTHWTTWKSGRHNSDERKRVT